MTKLIYLFYLFNFNNENIKYKKTEIYFIANFLLKKKQLLYMITGNFDYVLTFHFKSWVTILQYEKLCHLEEMSSM